MRKPSFGVSPSWFYLTDRGTLVPTCVRAVEQGTGISPLLWPSAWFDGAVFLLRSIVNQVFVEKT